MAERDDPADPGGRRQPDRRDASVPAGPTSSGFDVPEAVRSVSGARSWPEFVETLQGGIALIDDRWRLAFVSERFLPDLASADDLVGREVQEILPALGNDDPRGLRAQVEQGNTRGLELSVATSDDERRSIRVTVVPLRILGNGIKAAIFTKDTTETSEALTQLGNATLRLTEIEDELDRRVVRELHDGPIQLLAALVIRLDLLEDLARTTEMRDSASNVISHLRDAIGELDVGAGRATAGSLLERWIAPLLINSKLSFEIEDHLAAKPPDAVTLSTFVFLHLLVSAARLQGGAHLLRATLSDERGGYRINLTITAAQSIRDGRLAVQYRVAVDYARSVGGTISTHVDDDGIRTMSIWLRRIGQSGVVEPLDLALTSRQGPDRAVNDIGSLPALSDEAWEELAHGVPSRLLELDLDQKLTFINSAQEMMFGKTADEVVGRGLGSFVIADSLASLESEYEKLAAGEVIDTAWLRENAHGEVRLARLTASPRFDERGAWAGVLVAFDDLSDPTFLRELYESALADLNQARRMATHDALLRVEAPVVASEELVARLRGFEASMSDPAPIRAVRVGLEDALTKLRESLSGLTTPDLSAGDLGGAVRTSLATILADATLMSVDETSVPPPPQTAEVLYRIGREAVINAVIHGRADHITMTIRDDRAGLNLDIEDDGVGIEASDLVPTPGHLGTRAMMERARKRGGTCRIEPAAQGGTLVSVWLPERADSPTMFDSLATHPEA